MAILYRDPAAPPPGDYDVHRLAAPAAALVDTASALWHDARPIEWGPERYRTRFQALWDAEALHVRFDSVDDSPWHTMTTRDEHIWNEEVIEIFLDATGAGVNYAELEISPVNVVCDLRVETPWPSVKSLTEWDWDGHDERGRPPEGRARRLRRLDGAGAPSVGRPRDHDAGDGRENAAEAGGRLAVQRLPDQAARRPGQAGGRRVFAAWSVPDGPSFHRPAAFRPFRFL
jgi:hypothetical protein